MKKVMAEEHLSNVIVGNEFDMINHIYQLLTLPER